MFRRATSRSTFGWSRVAAMSGVKIIIKKNSKKSKTLFLAVMTTLLYDCYINMLFVSPAKCQRPPPTTRKSVPNCENRAFKRTTDMRKRYSTPRRNAQRRFPAHSDQIKHFLSVFVAFPPGQPGFGIFCTDVICKK